MPTPLTFREGQTQSDTHLAGQIRSGAGKPYTLLTCSKPATNNVLDRAPYRGVNRTGESIQKVPSEILLLFLSSTARKLQRLVRFSSQGQARARLKI